MQPVPSSDTLTFEVVSLETAREALEEPPAGVLRLGGSSRADWIARRRPVTDADRRLGRAAAEWMIALPRDVRPIELLRRYPRIANALSACWSDGEAALHMLDGLVMDRRGGRQGFPREIARELLVLREHLQRAARRIPA